LSIKFKSTTHHVCCLVKLNNKAANGSQQMLNNKKCLDSLKFLNIAINWAAITIEF